MQAVRLGLKKMDGDTSARQAHALGWREIMGFIAAGERSVFDSEQGPLPIRSEPLAREPDV